MIAEYPYNSFKLYKVFHKKEGRYYANLVPLDKAARRKTISWARYLVSVFLKRILEPHEHVDHINNVKTDDRIENLQILSNAENIRKSTKDRNIVTLECFNCYKLFLREKRQVHSERYFCSRICLHENLKNLTKFEIVHGTKVAYGYHACRCNICKEGNTLRMREYKKKKKLRKIE